MNRSGPVSEEKAVRRIALNDYIILSRQLLINRKASRDQDKRSAKMLVVLASGQQQIITFTLPSSSCTVQDLLRQMGVKFDDSTTIDCMENAGGSIHVVVSVGIDISATDPQMVAQAEEFYREMHQSKAAAPPTTPGEETSTPAAGKPTATVANNPTKSKKHKKSRSAHERSSVDQDANARRSKKRKKCHSAEDNNGHPAAGAQDNNGLSSKKPGNRHAASETPTAAKKSNGCPVVQPAGDAIQSNVRKKSEETAGGTQSRAPSNVASTCLPAKPTPEERAEQSRLRRNRKWILSRDFDDEDVVLLSSEDEETNAAGDGQTEEAKPDGGGQSAERRLSADENLHLFKYPPTGTGGLSISMKDYMCLSSGTYLNDVIIDFYLCWLKNNIIPEGQRERTHIFSIFFHKRLNTVTLPNKVRQTAAQKRHKVVQRWTRTVNIFDKDFIIIPFNDQAHWILAIICFPSLRGPVAYNDAESSTRSDDIPIKQPVILIFDSYPVYSRQRAIDILRDYLTCEYQAKNPNAQAHIFTKDNMPAHRVEVPQQENLTDCGLYLLQYVEQFFTTPIRDYRLPIRKLRNWFDPLTVTKKREDIAKLIQQLMDEGNQQQQQQSKMLPVIKFPTLNGQLVMEEEEEEDEDKESDSKAEDDKDEDRAYASRKSDDEDEEQTKQEDSKVRQPAKRRNTIDATHN
ncbi:ubiquitin-like-specific protease 2 [Drosophila teissieri]|uniref:ubiquitin-like-specific protease 2 n=1 Tax=Drosophila teissieri TaxID=7243 RepID=UPI001CBA2D42|nr:ubiquitin-like-specific protease 2 [Drosophila teissieri]